ncbi:hypothetical protein [Paenibacillus sp. FSL L8-0708]
MRERKIAATSASAARELARDKSVKSKRESSEEIASMADLYARTRTATS